METADIEQKEADLQELPMAPAELQVLEEESDSSPAKASKPRSRKLLLWAGVAAVLLVILGWVLFQGQGGTEYRTARVERGDIQSTVSASGSPNAVVTVQVGSQVSGNISALYVDFNTKVK